MYLEAVKASNRLSVVPAFRTEITNAEFNKFKAWIYNAAGITMSDHKKALVMGRLASRLRFYKLGSYDDYFSLLTDRDGTEELQIAVDLLTTNETYFFREPKHFDFLRDEILKNHAPGRPMRVWSAASSSGEEPYSLAMMLHDCLGETPWDILASDLSTRVLDKARSGHYAIDRSRHIPEKYLQKYCFKGVKEQQGTFLVNSSLKKRIKFKQINLNETLPETGEFDLIVIRNVMIYFNAETRQRVIERIIQRLKPGGYLFIGHSESLNGITDRVKSVKPAIYHKP